MYSYIAFYYLPVSYLFFIWSLVSELCVFYWTFFQQIQLFTLLILSIMVLFGWYLVVFFLFYLCHLPSFFLQIHLSLFPSRFLYDLNHRPFFFNISLGHKFPLGLKNCFSQIPHILICCIYIIFLFYI